MATKKDQEVLDQIEVNNAPAVEEERIKEAMDMEEEEAVTVESQQMQALNTTKSLRSHNKTNAELAKETKDAQKKFKNEKLEKVSIPAVLQPKLGPLQFLSINGVSVNVPVDGEEYEIPKSHAKLLKEYIRNLK